MDRPTDAEEAKAGAIEIVTGTQAELNAAIEHEAARIAAEGSRRRALARGRWLLFLDFDGVLNHSAFLSAMAKRGLEGGEEPVAFDRACVARLNILVREMNAVVVVSSSWREGRDVEELQALLDRHGFVGTVIDTTPNWGYAAPGSKLALGRSRGHEIRAWLDDLPEPTHRFLVLDDDSDMEPVRQHFVKTKFHEGGLTDSVLEGALRRVRQIAAKWPEPDALVRRSTPVRLWLDDVRDPPDGSWTVARTAGEALELLSSVPVERASLDHDLGECKACAEKRDCAVVTSTCRHLMTGYDLVKWMAETSTWPKQKPTVHSMNPVGAANMLAIIERYWTPPAEPPPHEAPPVENGPSLFCQACGHVRVALGSGLCQGCLQTFSG